MNHETNVGLPIVSLTCVLRATCLGEIIGKRIHEEILNHRRADYGKQIISMLGKELKEQYGKGFSAKNIRRMIQFYEVFPDCKMVITLWRQLS